MAAYLRQRLPWRLLLFRFLRLRHMAVPPRQNPLRLRGDSRPAAVVRILDRVPGGRAPADVHDAVLRAALAQRRVSPGRTGSLPAGRPGRRHGQPQGPASRWRSHVTPARYDHMTPCLRTWPMIRWDAVADRPGAPAPGR